MREKDRWFLVDYEKTFAEELYKQWVRDCNRTVENAEKRIWPEIASEIAEKERQWTKPKVLPNPP